MTGQATQPLNVCGVTVPAPTFTDGEVIVEAIVIVKAYRADSNQPVLRMTASPGWSWIEKAGAFSVYHDSALAQANREDYR